MAKRRMNRTKKRRQRGGFWPFTSSEPGATSTSSWTSWFSNKAKETTNSVENTLGNLSSSVSNTFSSSSEPQTIQQTTSSMPMQTSYGGKTKRRHKRNSKRTKRRMRGGNKLGLTYYATPVSGIKMAEPTYWIKGGKR